MMVMMKMCSSGGGVAGLLESSMRLKPHEAQSYRKKALWVSWVSIVVTILLAIAAFSEYCRPCPTTQALSHYTDPVPLHRPCPTTQALSQLVYLLTYWSVPVTML